MAFNDLFSVYPNRNPELRAVAKTFYEFGQTIAREPSAAHSNGMDEHALTRQKSYVEHALNMVEAINGKPIPDGPAVHPTDLPIDLSVLYATFVVDLGGNEVPINESTQLLAEKWLMTAVELAKSQSAAIAGSLVEFDYTRAVNNIGTISKLIAEIEERPFLDLPETAKPDAAHKPRSSRS